MIPRVLAGIVLFSRFLSAVVVSGLSVLVLIIAPSRGGHARLARIPFHVQSPGGASLLGALVTLTPGTTVLEIDLQRMHMLIHVLDGRDLDSVQASIHRDFERWILILFGERRSR